MSLPGWNLSARGICRIIWAGIRTVGTDIDKLMPPVSRFGSGNREKKKQGIIDKLKAFFAKYFGIGGPARFTPSVYDNNIHEDVQDMVAEGQAKY